MVGYRSGTGRGAGPFRDRLRVYVNRHRAYKARAQPVRTSDCSAAKLRSRTNVNLTAAVYVPVNQAHFQAVC
jgi:hypothetical protein